MNVALEASAAIYVSLAVALSVWIGIFVYLWRIDAQARDLRRRIEQLPEQVADATPTAVLQVQERTLRAERPEHNLEDLVEKP
jgi:CcmD family protein